MDNIEYNITMSDAVEMIVEKLENHLDLSTKRENWNEVTEKELELNLLSNVAVVSSDSLYRMAVRMGYEGTEEDFVNFLMSESKDGFINVDNRYPLESGHYTLQTAVAAVAADTTLSPEQKNGMIFTFYNGTGWDAFQFNKAYTAEDFADPDNWQPLGSPIATENTSGRTKITDTIDGDSPQDVESNVAATPKAVVDYVNNFQGKSFLRFDDYTVFPLIGKADVLYLADDTGFLWVWESDHYRLISDNWKQIQRIQGILN